MKIFAISDIHGAIRSIEKAAHLIREADAVVISGDITHTKRGRGECSGLSGAIFKTDPRRAWQLGSGKSATSRRKGLSLRQRRFWTGRDSSASEGIADPIPTATVYSEEEIARILKTGYEQVRQVSRLVLISHAPPRSVRDRSFIGLRGGSRSVQAFLANHPVSLCLCGHIHEAHGIERFQNTLVVNTGSFKKGRYATIEIGANPAVTPGKLG